VLQNGCYRKQRPTSQATPCHGHSATVNDKGSGLSTSFSSQQRVDCIAPQHHSLLLGWTSRNTTFPTTCLVFLTILATWQLQRSNARQLLLLLQLRTKDTPSKTGRPTPRPVLGTILQQRATM
jgi:hypothetical protein